MIKEAKQLTVSEARAFLDSSRLGHRTVLDVRQDFEYAEGHLPGATLIPLPDLADRHTELDLTLPTLVYCRSGKRSLAAANLLLGFGFREVMSVNGGILAWDGAQAFGPIDLGLETLLSAQTPRQILEQALGLELSLQGYYQRLGDASADKELADLYSRLAGYEDRHRRTLGQLWLRIGDGDELELRKRERDCAENGRIEGGLCPEDYTLLLGDSGDIAQALELSMAIEAQALDLYMRKAGSAKDPDMRRTLLLLAEEEKAHLKVLGAFVGGRKRF